MVMSMARLATDAAGAVPLTDDVNDVETTVLNEAVSHFVRPTDYTEVCILSRVFGQQGKIQSGVFWCYYFEWTKQLESGENELHFDKRHLGPQRSTCDVASLQKCSLDHPKMYS
jgi:hypothetical protein